MALQIVIVDDDREMGKLLADFLSERGYQTETYDNAVSALDDLNSGKLDPLKTKLVITDLNMPQMTGMKFIEEMKARHGHIPVVLMTAFGSVDTAIEAMHKGAFHYIVKPFKLNEVGAIVERALQFNELQKQNLILRRELKNTHGLGNIIGKSSSMKQVFDLIERVAHANANVLINGESGTGKELVARAIHNLGARAKKPIVAINCTAIPDGLLESELFGHEKGSFTGAIGRKRGLFEEADGGTLFLDEIGDMNMQLQAKLLRAIQEKKIRPVGGNVDHSVDVRIVAATHKDLKAAIRDGRFREDLYYRLCVIPIVIPPLRHRHEDIPLLAEAFLEKYSAENGTKIQGFTKEAIQKLVNARWEGNVRELENVIERAVVLCRGQFIGAEDLPMSENVSQDSFMAQISEEMPTLDEIERRYIRLVLDKVGGKKEKAAHILGVNRRTLYRKEREYGWVEVNAEEEE